MNNNITVYKLNEEGAEVLDYPGQVLRYDGHSIQLEALFSRDRADMGFVVFLRGDRFVESFYSDRWYNVFAVYQGATSVLKGWYCNISRPATISSSAVVWEDLALDLWVAADGRTQVLDEDEFDALNLSAAERAQCWLALADLQDQAVRGTLPR